MPSRMKNTGMLLPARIGKEDSAMRDRYKNEGVGTVHPFHLPSVSSRCSISGQQVGAQLWVQRIRTYKIPVAMLRVELDLQGHPVSG